MIGFDQARTQILCIVNKGCVIVLCRERHCKIFFEKYCFKVFIAFCLLASCRKNVIVGRNALLFLFAKQIKEAKTEIYLSIHIYQHYLPHQNISIKILVFEKQVEWTRHESLFVRNDQKINTINIIKRFYVFLFYSCARMRKQWMSIVGG